MQAVPLPALSGAEKRCAAAALWAAHRCTVRSSSGSSRSSTRSSGGAPLRVEWPPAGVDKAHDPKALGCRRLLPLLLVVVVVVLLLLLVLVLLPLALLAGLAVGMGLTVGGVGVLGVLVGMLAAEAEPQGSGGSRWDAACQRPWHGDTTKAVAKAGRARGKTLATRCPSHREGGKQSASPAAMVVLVVVLMPLLLLLACLAVPALLSLVVVVVMLVLLLLLLLLLLQRARRRHCPPVLPLDVEVGHHPLGVLPKHLWRGRGKRQHLSVGWV